MPNPTQYLVVRSPFAESMLIGLKNREFRSWASRLARKTVAIAVARSKTDSADIDEEIEIWEGSEKQRKDLIALCKSNPHGKIIGAVEFGGYCETDVGPCVAVEKYELWDRKNWIDSPGGLGLRYIPQKL